jgi:hypothetical protein
VDCSEFDGQCTVGVCDPADGSCSAQPANEGAACDDGNACTENDTCSGGMCAGTPLVCDDGNVCTADSCDPATGCVFEPLTGGEITCGQGACQTTVPECLDGVPQTCTPGAPAPETCNGIDDDCDGFVDNEPVASASCDDGDPGTNDACVQGMCQSDMPVVAQCKVTPTTLNVRSEGRTVGFELTLSNALTGSPVDPLSLGPVHISKVDIPSQGGVLTLPTPDFGPGCTVDGIWENPTKREVSADGASLKILFDTPSDGNCETLDGNRQDIIALLLGALDGEIVGLFVAGDYPGASGPVECGSTVRVENRGVR